VVSTHGRDELLHIAGDHRRRGVLPFGLLEDVVDQELGVQSVPHDDGPEVLLCLKLLHDREHFCPNVAVVLADVLQPLHLPLTVIVDLSAQTLVIATDGLQDLFAFGQDDVLHLRVKLVALIYLAYLGHSE
jgi:hypothetical protein